MGVRFDSLAVVLGRGGAINSSSPLYPPLFVAAVLAACSVLSERMRVPIVPCSCWCGVLRDVTSSRRKLRE